MAVLEWREALCSADPAAAIPSCGGAHTWSMAGAGLDSATTFTVVKYLGDLARTMRCTTVVSLLQPSGDVLALFDDVMLLADG